MRPVSKSKEEATQRVLHQLSSLARDAGASVEEGWLFSLAWAVAAAGATDHAIPRVVSPKDLLDLNAWDTLARHIDDPTGSLSTRSPWLVRAITGSVGAHAYSVTVGLADEFRDAPLDLMDSCWLFSSQSRSVHGFPAAYAPALSDLVVAMLDVEAESNVWVPFDATGQLALRVARAGGTAWVTRPDLRPLLGLRLLLLAEPDDVRRRVRLDPIDQVVEHEWPTFSHVLVNAPMNARVERSGSWMEYERAPRYRNLDVHPGDFARSDAWAISTFWPAARGIAVFLVSPQILFAKGQEAILRRELTRVDGPTDVAGVISLPSGMLSSTNLAPVVMLFASDLDRHAARMLDLSGATKDGYVRARLGRDVDVHSAQRLLGSDDFVPDVAATVSVLRIRDAEYSLVPSRYTRQVVDLSGHRVPLGELLLGGVIKPPPPLRGAEAEEVYEIGPAQLDRWQPIEVDLERTALVPLRSLVQATLRPGDLVISVKGSIGKVGIIGTSSGASPGNKEETDRVVSATTCIALRPHPAKVFPEFLLAYLRSDDFKGQLEALKVGASIAHVTPATLLAGIQVPLPSLEDQGRICEQYMELTQMEKQIDEIRAMISRAEASLFSTIKQKRGQPNASHA